VDLRGKSVFVIDAHNLIFQVFYALPEMTGPHGQSLGAVFGFTRDLLMLIEQQHPDLLFCAFDRPGKTFRHELFEAYKADRGEMPDELGPQIGAIRRLLELLEVPILELEGYEADDVIATLSRRVEHHGGHCFVVTGDKDCRQLISPHTQLFDIRKNQAFDAAALRDTWGIRPDQVVDFQALVGDSIDNIPGVPLIGPKTAGELLGRFGTLGDLLDNIDAVPGKKRKENLLACRDQLLLSEQLVRLVDDLPLRVDWKRGRAESFRWSAANELFREWGFRGLADRARALSTVSDAPSEWVTDYQTAASSDAVRHLASLLKQQAAVAIDLRLTQAEPASRGWDVRGIAFCWQPGVSRYVEWPGVRQESGERTTALRQILEDPAIAKHGHDLKRAAVALRRQGIQLRGADLDTMLASYLINAGTRAHGLKELCQDYLQRSPLAAEPGPGQAADVSGQEAARHVSHRADLVWRLAPLMRESLRQEGQELLYRDLELPLLDVLAGMEFDGIRVDVARLRDLGDRFQAKMARLEHEIHELAGHPFNIGSPKQLRVVLFEELDLPVVKRTRSGPSTDAEVLEELAAQHPIPARILAYRQFAKLQSTYIDALPQLVNPDTGRVHTTFNQVAAATGRLSSNEPNLQNIPVRSAEGRDIRSAFQPDPRDWRLLCADYSQIELRVLADLSRDEALVEAFARDEDVHARVASEVFAVSPEQVTEELRRRAKAINFGVIYGQSPFGLARALSISREEAGQFIDAYFERYPGVDEFSRKVLADCRRKGYVETRSGRRRRIQGVRDPSKLGPSRQRNLPERTAINTVIQGSAADLIKQAMLLVHRRMQREAWEARMLLQIHDELVFEVPDEDVSRLAELVAGEMTRVGPLSVPLKVDVKAGTDWTHCEPFQLQR
jgi:DNA polymerase-1